MLFHQPFVLPTLLFLVLGGISSFWIKESLKIKKCLIFLATLVLGPAILLQEERIFGLEFLYFLLLIIQCVELFWKAKESISLYTISLLFMTCLLSLSKTLIYDLSCIGSSIVILLVIFNENRRMENLNHATEIFLSFLILFSLFFIFVLGMMVNTEFSSYEKFLIHFPQQYSLGLLFLLSFLFFLLFLFPFMGMNKLFDKSQPNAQLIWAISIFYYGLLSKFTWVFQHLWNSLPSPLYQEYFWRMGNIFFGLCLILWPLRIFSSKKSWQDKLISLCCLNFSISILMSFSELNEVIVDRFQWLLLSTIIPLIIWSFLNNLEKNHSVPRFYYSLVLLVLCGAPLGVTFLIKLFLSLSFYNQNSFSEYIIYFVLSQAASFWVASEFFTQSLKTRKTRPIPLN